MHYLLVIELNLFYRKNSLDVKKGSEFDNILSVFIKKTD